MKYYDDALPEGLQVPTLLSAVTDQDFLGSVSGKTAFGYAMTCEPVAESAANSILAQFRAIDLIGRAFTITIPHNMIFIDVAASSHSTGRGGLHRLRVACRSALFDTHTIVCQSPCRISRMPDELEMLRKEWAALGINMIYQTTMPATSLAEVDRYFHRPDPSGFTS